jgi:hypothetical protein
MIEPAERSDSALARWRRKLVVLFRRRRLMPYVEAATLIAAITIGAGSSLMITG